MGFIDRHLIKVCGLIGLHLFLFRVSGVTWQLPLAFFVHSPFA